MIKVTHNQGGIFSCSSVRLHKIINYFNSKKNLPKKVDSSLQYSLYKEDKNKDITFDYFENYDENDIEIKYTNKVLYHHNYQFKDYKTIDFEILFPFIQKYFNPSIIVKNLIKELENKYNIDYDNTCVLFLRGNDKVTEHPVPSYDKYIKHGLELDNNIKFLVQSDETEFIDTMLKTFKNSFYFKDEIRHINKKMSTVVYSFKDNHYKFSLYYVAITYIMSKCKYVICSTGNCSIWIALFRGNSKNIIQLLK